MSGGDEAPATKDYTMTRTMTPALTVALQYLAGQQLAALTMPGAYSPSLTGGQGNTITQLRALHRRGLASRVTVRGLEGYTITDTGLELVASYARQRCADVRAEAERGLRSSYPGVVAWAQQKVAGTEQMLARLG